MEFPFPYPKYRPWYWRRLPQVSPSVLEASSRWDEGAGAVLAHRKVRQIGSSGVPAGGLWEEGTCAI